MRRSQSEGKKTEKEEKTVKESKTDDDDAADDDDDDDLEASFGMSFLWDIALKALDTEVIWIHRLI